MTATVDSNTTEQAPVPLGENPGMALVAMREGGERDLPRELTDDERRMVFESYPYKESAGGRICESYRLVVLPWEHDGSHSRGWRLGDSYRWMPEHLHNRAAWHVRTENLVPVNPLLTGQVVTYDGYLWVVIDPQVGGDRQIVSVIRDCADILTMRYDSFTPYEGVVAPTWLAQVRARIEQEAARATSQFEILREECTTLTSEHETWLKDLTSAAHQWANYEGHCSEFDEAMERIGLRGRSRKEEITVTCEVTGRIDGEDLLRDMGFNPASCTDEVGTYTFSSERTVEVDEDECGCDKVVDWDFNLPRRFSEDERTVTCDNCR